MALRLLALVVVDAEVPLRVRPPTVLLDEGVFRVGAWLVLAPVVAVVICELALERELAGLAVAGVVELHGHVTGGRPLALVVQWQSVKTSATSRSSPMST